MHRPRPSHLGAPDTLHIFPPSAFQSLPPPIPRLADGRGRVTRPNRRRWKKGSGEAVAVDPRPLV